jgi:hypothetical protein
VEESRRLLEGATPSGWHARQENPVIIPKVDEPEPDLAVVRGTPRTDVSQHPGPTDVGLLVDVGETMGENAMKVFKRWGLGVLALFLAVGWSYREAALAIGGAREVASGTTNLDQVEMVSYGESRRA